MLPTGCEAVAGAALVVGAAEETLTLEEGAAGVEEDTVDEVKLGVGVGLGVDEVCCTLLVVEGEGGGGGGLELEVCVGGGGGGVDEVVGAGSPPPTVQEP